LSKNIDNAVDNAEILTQRADNDDNAISLTFAEVCKLVSRLTDAEWQKLIELRTQTQPLPAQVTPAEFAEQIRKAIANFDRSLAIEVTTALKDKIQLRKEVRAALTVEEFENFRLLVTAGFVKGTRVKYVGHPRYAEQFEGVELVVDSIDAHSQISCLKPDGYLTGKLKPEELKAIS
jgi:hypothetical protein